ncbi:DUF3224 domain-containing protein [Pseudoalteromonas tunicata]|jgi:hypothetical protein|uniref:DUF3224 domain-containing protein n=1 Tax=Pseudoalteromonas tunicata D2 TaxID=87626 RepID=A4CDL9_9GAMM|nr:DUF3224 domain-containing protein [Pseudoalteromonas tunicata]ATC96450.1 hypothetical protein PTUN_a4256 [Pseudoalteromonas tunicata]AXT31932.1 DUF3224 domain-containing protein [Pseudoalteromonas tunicata]EAR27061.1 hypothetical protein PTD2_05305 [Pseudoalteromonas tunicata D2]
MTQTQLIGTFQITNWQETPYSESDTGAKQSLAIISQQYSGDAEGTSELRYLMSYQPDGTAQFVGFETFTGTINGQAGTLVLQHQGQFVAGVASSTFSIVEGSGTSELATVKGEGSFTTVEHSQANYQISPS